MGVLTLSLFCLLLAQDTPKVAIHPLQVQAERHEADLRIRFMQEVLQRRISSVGTRQIPGWLATQPKASCQGKTECLMKLAEAMGATYALYASLKVNEGDFQMSAKIVRADGAVLSHVERLLHPRNVQQHWGEDAQQAFKVLLNTLQPEALAIRPLMLAAEEKAAAAQEEPAAQEEEAAVPTMELDFQELSVEDAKPLSRRNVSRRALRSPRGTLQNPEEAFENPAATQGSQLRVPSEIPSQISVFRIVEPLTGWAPPSSAWTRPRHVELRDKPTPLRTAAFVMTGVSGAALAAGGIFGLMAKNRRSFLERNAPNGLVQPGVGPDELWSAHKKAQLYPKIGVYLAGSGAVLAGTAISLFILSHLLDEGIPFRLAPMRDGLLLSFQKRF
ncbi:MAG: hypothetical protein FWG75_06075 [Cystobacterineae bacterium]|nr:hypothetical protein [Cystobacterineae bacterium]